MKKSLKVGLAAFGMSGKVFHGPLLHAHPNFDLAVVYERSHEKSRHEYPYVKIVRNFDELIQDPTLDLIVINTPQDLHHSMCKAALLAGKHVVVEKPFTVTFAEAKDLIELAKAQGKLLTVFQNRRWDGDFLTVKKVVENKLLGQLVEYEAHFDRFRNFIQPDTWKEEVRPGGGILYNLGSHLIDQAIHLFGLPKSVFADIRIVRPEGKVDDCFELILDYQEIKVSLKSSYLVREEMPRYILHGTMGSFTKKGIDPQEEDLAKGILPGAENWGVEDPKFYGKLNTEIKDLHYQGILQTLPGDYRNFYNRLYDALIDNKELPMNPEDSMHGIRIIEAAIKSHEEKRVIEL